MEQPHKTRQVMQLALLVTIESGFTVQLAPLREPANHMDASCMGSNRTVPKAGAAFLVRQDPGTLASWWPTPGDRLTARYTVWCTVTPPLRSKKSAGFQRSAN